MERLRYLYRAYRYRWRVDPAEIRFLCERLLPGDVAVDVGAFKGAYTYWMRRCVGASGAVVAFEPQPEQAAYIRRMIAAMKWRNVVVEAKGVSDAVGRVAAIPAGIGPRSDVCRTQGGGTIVRDRHRPRDDARRFFRPSIARPDFLKIDVEGHELAVLQGRRRRFPHIGRRSLWSAKPVTARTATCGLCSTCSNLLATRAAFSAAATAGRSPHSTRTKINSTYPAASCRPATSTISPSSSRIALKLDKRGKLPRKSRQTLARF